MQTPNNFGLIVLIVLGVILGIYGAYKLFSGWNAAIAAQKLREGPNNPSPYTIYKAVQRKSDNAWQLVAQKTYKSITKGSTTQILETEYSIMSKPTNVDLVESNTTIFASSAEAKTFYDTPYTATPVNKVYFVNENGAKFSDVYAS